jgi:hypothetical protein
MSWHGDSSSLLLGFLCTVKTPSIRGSVVQLYPPASPYIKNSFEWVLIYEIAGGFINKYFNYADPTSLLSSYLGLSVGTIISSPGRVGEVSAKPTDLSSAGTVFNRVISLPNGFKPI